MGFRGLRYHIKGKITVTAIRVKNNRKRKIKNRRIGEKIRRRIYLN